MNENESIIKLKSANKCAWLLTKGYQPLYAAVDEDGMAYLVFEMDDSVQQCLNSFYMPDNSIDLAIYNFLRNYKITRQLMSEALA